MGAFDCAESADVLPGAGAFAADAAGNVVLASAWTRRRDALMAVRERELAGHEPRRRAQGVVAARGGGAARPRATPRDISAGERASRRPPRTGCSTCWWPMATWCGSPTCPASRSAAAPASSPGRCRNRDAEFRPIPAVVEELRARVRFGIFVASYTDGRVRLVDRDPDHELTGEGAIGTHLHASAIGKLLLAQRPELAPAPLRAVTARTITRPDALTAELTSIRVSDVAREVDELRWGRSALAVPVRDRNRAVIGCLVAIGRTGRIGVDDAGLAQLLHRYAERAVSLATSRET